MSDHDEREINKTFAQPPKEVGMSDEDTKTDAEWQLTNSVGGWDDLDFKVVDAGKRAQADTSLGSYKVELLPDRKRMELTLTSGSEVRTCPTKFQAINRAEWEAADHHRRLLAQVEAELRPGQQPPRLKAPKW
jgi:hypothetical protein